MINDLESDEDLIAGKIYRISPPESATHKR